MKKLNIICWLMLFGANLKAQESINNTGNLHLLAGSSVAIFGDFTHTGLLTVNAGAELINKRIFTLSTGIVTNSGTYTYGNSATLIYAGNVTQFSGAELPVLNGPPTTVINNANGVELINNTTVTNLTFVTGNLTLGEHTLTLNGNYTRASGSLFLNGNSNLIIGGSGALTNALFFDQSNLGTSNKINNLTINRISETITLANSLEVKGTVFPDNGTLVSGGNLTLNSDINTTARIAAIGAAANVTGNVIIQRYIPAAARRFRFMATPINGNLLADWRSEMFITGNGTGTVIGTINSNGFDATLTNQPSVFYYTETLGGDFNSRWQAANTTSMPLEPARGYRVFVRGDRSDYDRLRGLLNTQNALTLTSIGVINKANTSNISFPVTYSGSSVNDGWNMVGNPFPSQIDWNALLGWNKTNIANTIWIWNAATNSYGNWDGAIGTNSVTQYIASHQGFFVRSNGVSPLLNCSELVKVGNATPILFKNAIANLLRIKLIKDSVNTDEAVVCFKQNMHDEYIENEDIVKYTNPTLNIASVLGNNFKASVNYMDEYFDKKRVLLAVDADIEGTYQLIFSQMESFTPMANIYLIDHFKQTQKQINFNNKYTFSITNNPSSQGNNRFELAFYNNTTFVNNVMDNNEVKVVVFPIPSSNDLTLKLMAGLAEKSDYTITAIDGKVLKMGQVNFSQASTLTIDISDLNSGLYLLNINFKNSQQVVKFNKVSN